MTGGKLVNFKADAETVELAKSKLEHGEMSERLRQTLEHIAHGADVSERTRLKDQLQEKRRQRREVEQELSTLQSERDELDRDIERIEQRLDELLDKQGEYDGALSMLESELHSGEYVYSEKASVKQAATVGECSPESVVDDVRDRNGDVPDAAFEMPTVHGPNDWREAADGYDTTPNKDKETK